MFQVRIQVGDGWSPMFQVSVRLLRVVVRQASSQGRLVMVRPV